MIADNLLKIKENIEKAEQDKNIQEQSYTYVYKLFDEYDKDGNGVLDRVEFVNIWKKVDPTLDIGLITELFDATDLDKSGSIDFNEYLNIIANVKAQVV